MPSPSIVRLPGKSIFIPTLRVIFFVKLSSSFVSPNSISDVFVKGEPESLCCEYNSKPAAAEYVFSNGNERILLCERGIRSFETAYRNTLDLNAIPILKEKSHLPVVVDPSHGIGIRKHVARMALAGVIAGADAVIVEVHETPEKAASDGQQTLDFKEAGALYRQLLELRALSLSL